MSFKPLIIDAGQFKQLPSGQALDVGGWTLPTSGGTEDYVLIADASGNAVWDTVDHGGLVGLTDDDHPQYNNKTGWASDFAQSGDTTISVNNGTLTLSITPTGANFEFWVQGIKYTKTTQQDVVFTDTEGLWFFYFNNSGTLTASQTPWDIKADNWGGVCIGYWDATNNLLILIGPEYHSYEMDPATHEYLHFTFGTRWSSGLGVVINGDNLDVGAGHVYDEDIDIYVTDSPAGGMWQQDLTPASLPIFYRTGSGDWRKMTASTTPVYLDTNAPQINTLSGTWGWTAVGNNQYFVYWVVVTNDQSEPVILVPGQESSTTLNATRAGNQLADMLFGNLPTAETKVVARVIMQRNGSTPYYSLIEVNDYRDVSDEPSSGGSVIGDHGNLTGLGDNDHPHYVMYIGATANVDLGSYTLTTTGTVVGSNIPAPTIDDQVLIATAAGVASWSTAGNSQLLGSNVSGEVVWENKSFGYSIPANSAVNEIYVGTGAGTAAWTTDLTGLTSLTVDNITINGAVISSDTGAISFSNENLATTGSMTANTITDGTATLTGGSLTGVKLGSLTTNGFVKTSGSDGTLSVDTSTYLTAESDTLDTVADRGATTDQTLTTGGLTTTGTVDAGLLTVDNITINGAVISSDTGAISFSNENLATTGSMTAGSISSDTITLSQGIYHNHGDGAHTYDKVFSNYTTGSPVTGTLVIDLPVAFTNNFLTFKIRGYVYSSPFGPWEVNFGGYNYNATPDRWYSYRASVLGEVPFTLIRCGYNGNTGKACLMLGTTTTEWGYFSVTEITDLVSAGGSSVGLETGWDIQYYTDETNFYNNDANQLDPLTLAWNRDYNTPSAVSQILVATGDKVAGWTTDLTGLTLLTVDNITINGAVITSNTGAISFSNENLTTTGTLTGTNIPSPTADDQALSSSASGVASWNVTCLADVLAQEVPSASGGERKFVLTADSSSKFEIESAPWTIMLSTNETVYVRTTGNDTIGDGSSGSPFLTLERTIEYLGGLYIGDYTIMVDIGEGVFTEAGTLSFQHPFGGQVTWQGVSEQITSQDTNSISASGTSLGHSNLYRYDVTFILPVGKSVSVGDYIAVREISGGTLPEALYGCHYVSAWDGGTRTATVQVVYRNGAPKASGTVTCTVELIKTVIAFANKSGLKTSGPYHTGVWRGLVIQGDYNTSNTNAKYGTWMLNTPVISLGGSTSSGDAMGIVGFQTGIYAQNNAMVFGDYCFVSKCGTRCANAQNGGILSLRYARLSGANNNGIFAFNGSTVAASNVVVVAVGNDSVLSYQGSFIDAQSAYIDQNNATNALTADRWSGIDANGSSYSDSISPSTPGNNDGSYVIIT